MKSRLFVLTCKIRSRAQFFGVLAQQSSALMTICTVKGKLKLLETLYDNVPQNGSHVSAPVANDVCGVLVYMNEGVLGSLN